MANEAFLMAFHRDLIADRATQSRFRNAILKTVREGDRVLDLGAGTGVHAMFACQAGASRVYAVESDRVIELAREIVARNGFADRVELIRGLSSQVELPEKVDVIMANLGLDSTLRYLPEAMGRFLKDGGRVIPRSMEFVGAPVESPEAHGRDVAMWKDRCFGLDLEPMWTMAVNTVHVGRFGEDQLLCAPNRLFQVELAGMHDPDASGGATFTLGRSGTLHGIATWYVQWLDHDQMVTLAPPLDLPYPLWHHSFFPLREPVEVVAGDRVEVDVRLAPFTSAGTYLAWEIRVHGRAGVTATSRHSTLEGKPLSRESLHKQSPDYRPSLAPSGRAARVVLELAEDNEPLETIERETFRRFPELFHEDRSAAAFVSKVLGDFGS